MVHSLTHRVFILYLNAGKAAEETDPEAADLHNYSILVSREALQAFGF